MRWEWLVAPLPAALGLAVAVLTASERLANPIIYLRGDLGTLAVLAGLLLRRLGQRPRDGLGDGLRHIKESGLHRGTGSLRFQCPHRGFSQAVGRSTQG